MTNVVDRNLEALGAQGFRAIGLPAGLKKNGKADMALLLADGPCVAAAVATTNQVKAAPVLVNQKHLRSGKVRAILMNAGNANAGTGVQGVRNTELLLKALSESLQCPLEETLMASTGVIGQQLPVDRMVSALPKLLKQATEDGFSKAAEAILTTDRYAKAATTTIHFGKKPVKISAFAKGAGMISPNMATMLAFVVTDAEIGRPALQTALREAVKPSFNSVTVDGDMSTNDTVIALANGLAGNTPLKPGTRNFKIFCHALMDVFTVLAKDMVMDGEGATKCVRVEVSGARTERDAVKIARQIGNSPLVKTAFFGEDANWGRILGAAGAAGVKFDPMKVDVYFDDVHLVTAGVLSAEKGAEDKATAVMKQPEFTIHVKLRSGKAQAHLYASDLSYEYIKINGSYRS